MEFIQMLFMVFLISWFLIFIYLFVFLYVHYAREHKVVLKEEVKSIPSYLNPANLSKLLYNKITPEVFTSTIILLINKGVLYFDRKDDDTFICVNRNNDLRLSSSQKYALKLLINYIGDGDKVSMKYLDGYCNSYNTSSNFYVNYQVWLKMILRETCDDMYYEPKMGYYKIKAFKYAGILLWTMNFYVGFRIPMGFFLLIPAFFISYYYYNVYRRTPESQEAYTKWMAYKEFLVNMKHIKMEDAIYAPILHVNERCSYDNDDLINKLNLILCDDIAKANSYGSKGPLF